MKVCDTAKDGKSGGLTVHYPKGTRVLVVKTKRGKGTCDSKELPKKVWGKKVLVHTFTFKGNDLDRQKWTSKSIKKNSVRGGVISRGEMIKRANYWFKYRPRLEYSMNHYFHDPESKKHMYRLDCSGYVSMALHLKGSAYTGNLQDHAARKKPLKKRRSMKAGDFTGLIGKGTGGRVGHVRIFHKWINKRAGTYLAYDFGKTPVKHKRYKLSTDKRYGKSFTSWRYKHIR